MDEALAFLGRLHVVVLHLPIGILVALGLVELRAWWRASAAPSASWSLALLGSVSAVLTAALGVLLSQNGNYDPTLLFRHKWLGIGVAACSVVAFVLKAAGANMRAYRSMLAVSCVLLLLGGHQGGSLTHGSGFLFASAPSVDVVDGNPAAAVLATHCYECHGSTQQESGLRLDQRDAILVGGDSGEPAVVPGRATASNLVRRVTLPRTDEDVMPPDGRQRLSAEEMLVLIDWINAGASLGPVVAVEAASDDAVDALIEAGIEIERLSETDPRLAVSLQFTGDDAGAEPALLLASVAPQVGWLNLKGRTLSDAEWAALARFENIARIHLEQTNVEDRHLEHLTNATRLEYLNVYDTNIGDAGMVLVSKLESLTDVYVWQTRVSDAGVAAVVENNASVRVHRGAVQSPR